MNICNMEVPLMKFLVLKKLTILNPLGNGLDINHNNNSEGNKMRIQFLDVKTTAEAIQQAPWAAKIIKVTGGFKAFESIDDYRMFLAQI